MGPPEVNGEQGKGGEHRDERGGGLTAGHRVGGHPRVDLGSCHGEIAGCFVSPEVARRVIEISGIAVASEIGLNRDDGHVVPR